MGAILMASDNAADRWDYVADVIRDDLIWHNTDEGYTYWCYVCDRLRDAAYRSHNNVPSVAGIIKPIPEPRTFNKYGSKIHVSADPNKVYTRIKRAVDVLVTVENWRLTPEGVDFWNTVVKKLEVIADNIATPATASNAWKEAESLCLQAPTETRSPNIRRLLLAYHAAKGQDQLS
jgi:hypothetical protein